MGSGPVLYMPEFISNPTRNSCMHWKSPVLAALLCTAASTAMAQKPVVWPVNSLDRPKPPVVDPGPAGPSVPPPADAIVLFSGKDLSEWQGDSGDAKWLVKDGYMEVAAGTGAIHTRRKFGDVQLHVEWASPASAEGEGQDRGNSGVFLMSHYEVQVLDSWHNDTYADGQAAALYAQSPPLVNASRAPGEWQTYDIVFHAPHFTSAGKIRTPARATVFHNGLIVQDDVAFTGWTVHARRAVYQPHEAELPLTLQDHGHPVRFRNIWIRKLGS